MQQVSHCILHQINLVSVCISHLQSEFRKIFKFAYFDTSLDVAADDDRTPTRRQHEEETGWPPEESPTKLKGDTACV